MKGQSIVICLLHGQRDVDAGSAAGLGFDADAAAMRLNDSADDGQTPPGSLGFGRAQDRRERPLSQLFTHSRAGVLELHRHVRRPVTRPRLADHA